MLKNDPPPGTPLTFVRQVQKAARNEKAVLVRAMQSYTVDRADDQFEVTYKGERMIVQRQDIEKSSDLEKSSS